MIRMRGEEILPCPLSRADGVLDPQSLQKRDQWLIVKRNYKTLIFLCVIKKWQWIYYKIIHIVGLLQQADSIPDENCIHSLSHVTHGLHEKWGRCTHLCIRFRPACTCGKQLQLIGWARASVDGGGAEQCEVAEHGGDRVGPSPGIRKARGLQGGCTVRYPGHSGLLLLGKLSPRKGARHQNSLQEKKTWREGSFS